MIYNPFDDNDSDGGTIFRDVIMLVLMGFVVIVLIILPYINPSKYDQNVDIKPPGNVMVEARWPDDINADVDLWVRAPGDIPVGYSNKGGLFFNLLRDDLGTLADATNINYENSYTRGIPEGEYIINVHLYKNMSGQYPIPVTIVISTRQVVQDNIRQIISSTVKLYDEGEEITVVRFRLDNHGQLVSGSINHLKYPLRNQKK